MHCLFVTPALDGPATGGTLYNRQLLAALELTFEQCSLAEVVQLTAAPQQVWVDSLYLAELPELRRQLTSARVGLLLHYLPSLLANPQLDAADELSEVERRALAHADMILTPSEYLRQLVLELCPGKPCVCASPGVSAARHSAAEQRGNTALMICNVTENKGVLPFLTALADVVPSHLTFPLEIAGSLQLEAAYAARCIALCQNHPWLRDHVQFLGSVPPAAVLEHLARASVFVSASRFESYGMALAEARAAGTPIIALTGGNVANLVAADSGGELVHSDRALAECLCRVVSDPIELEIRTSRARASTLVRPWSAAAREFEQFEQALSQRFSPASGKPSG